MAERKGSIKVSTENIFPVIRQWLYTDKDIFLREIVSNAADAITKLERLRTMGQWDEEEKPAYRIDVSYDKGQNLITVEDNGLGMTEEELDNYINNIAYSGAMAFIEKYQDQSDAGSGVIGHFGLGFYSSFMVSSKVRIDTLSWQEGAKACFWESDTGTDYTMGDGDRDTRGTKISMYLSDEVKDDFDAFKLRQILTKYAQFMPYPIYFHDIEEEEKKAQEALENDESQDEESKEEVVSTEPKPINNPNPLWTKSPSEISDEEYISFYHELFQDYRDPLFWIHLNMDYPFRLQGILYFPKAEEHMDTLAGRLKVYYNQVFVADDVKELIPDYLFLLRGCLDSPDLPLNVSRSNLQYDSNLEKLSNHIVRKVADQLKDLAKNEREKYESYWKDLSLFVRYGSLRDHKFYDRAKEAFLFESEDGTYKSFAELKESGKEKFYYTTDPKAQIAYIKRLTAKDEWVFLMEHELDLPFMQNLNMHDQLHFVRVDAEVAGESGNEDRKEQLERIFRKATGNDKLEIEVKGLGPDAEAAILTEDEETRAMRDLYERMGQDMGQDLDSLIPPKHTLVLNTDQSLITKLCLLDETSGKEETSLTLAEEIYDLARLSHGSLLGDDLLHFLKRSQTLLEQVDL